MINKKILFLLALISLLYLILDFASTGTLGEDDINLFLIARNSFKDPKLFFITPSVIYVLLASPFAQFGLIGVRIFNSIVAVLTCYVTFLVAKRVKIKDSVLSILILAFLPYFFLLALNGRPEILASLFFISSAYFYITRKYKVSSFLFSLLTSTSTIFYFLLPFWIFLLMRRKKYEAVPILFSIPILIFFITKTIFMDVIWLYRYFGPTEWLYRYFGPTEIRFENTITPYSLLKNFLVLAGPITLILSVFGFIRSALEKIDFLLIFSLFYIFIYLIFLLEGITFQHNVALLVPIAPIFALYASKYLSSLLNRIGIRTKTLIISILLFFIVLQYPLLYIRIPVPLNEEQRVMEMVVSWIVEKNYTNRTFYHDYPFFTCSIESKGFDLNHSSLLKARIESKEPSKGDMVICDTHFCFGDYKFTFSYFEKGYKLIKTFYSNKTNFKVLVFERI